MGRKVQPRESYLGDALHVMRLRDAARIDSRLSQSQIQEIDEKSTALIVCLMDIDKERSENGNQRKPARKS